EHSGNERQVRDGKGDLRARGPWSRKAERVAEQSDRSLYPPAESDVARHQQQPKRPNRDTAGPRYSERLERRRVQQRNQRKDRNDPRHKRDDHKRRSFGDLTGAQSHRRVNSVTY